MMHFITFRPTLVSAIFRQLSVVSDVFILQDKHNIRTLSLSIEFNLHSLTILFRPPDTFKLVSFQIFRYWAYLMKVIPEIHVGCTNFDIYVLIYTNSLGRVWRYQRSNQNPYIEEEQTTEWWKEKVQLSTKLKIE